MVFEGSLGPRPVCAIRVTRGGLEPSPRRTFPTSLTGDLKSEIAEDEAVSRELWESINLFAVSIGQLHDDDV